jgi:hypothetical protein
MHSLIHSFDNEVTVCVLADDEEVSSAEAYVETSSTAGAGGKERRAVKPKARTSSLSIERDDAITTQSSKHEKQTRRRDVSYTDEADYGEELDEDDDEIETAEEQVSTLLIYRNTVIF